MVLRQSRSVISPTVSLGNDTTTLKDRDINLIDALKKAFDTVKIKI